MLPGDPGSYHQVAPVITPSVVVPEDTLPDPKGPPTAIIDGKPMTDAQFRRTYLQKAMQNHSVFFSEEFFPFFEKNVMRNLGQSREMGDVYRAQGAFMLLDDMKKYVQQYTKPVTTVQ